MPVNIQLSLHDARTCWKKFYRGKHYYVGKGQCKGKSDMEGYHLAFDEWNALKRELDRLHGVRQNAYGLHTYTPDSSSDPLDEAAAMATAWDAVGAKPATSVTTRIGLTGTRLRPLAAEFLAHKKSEMTNGKISPKMYVQYSDKLEDFVRWMEHPEIHIFDVTRINGTLLADYRTRQTELMVSSAGKRGHGPYTASDFMPSCTGGFTSTKLSNRSPAPLTVITRRSQNPHQNPDSTHPMKSARSSMPQVKGQNFTWRWQSIAAIAKPT